MRLIGTLFVVVVLALAGVGAWLYIENDSRSVSRVPLPEEAARNGEASRQDQGAGGPISPVDPELLEQGPHGPLPRRAEGREPWRVYARPYRPQLEQPRIAILVVGLGLRRSTTDTAIEDLPPEVSLAFSPYAADLAGHVEAARRAGHEVLALLPVEPADSGRIDPGNRALLTGLGRDRIRDRLHWVMGRFAGYVGVVVKTPGPFVETEQHIGPVLAELHNRGLMFVDARPIGAGAAPPAAEETGVPHVRATAWLDDDPAPNAIEAQMARTEGIARASGAALVIGQPYPVTLQRIQRWTAELEREGFSVAPVTGLLNTRAGQ